MKNRISVELSENETIFIQHEGNWSNLSIQVNDELLGSVATKAELKLSRKFQMKDGRTFIVLLTDQGLELWHGGKELISGLASGTVDKFARACTVLRGYGYFLLIVVIIIFFVSEEYSLNLQDASAKYIIGLNLITIAFGLFFIYSARKTKTTFESKYLKYSYIFLIIKSLFLVLFGGLFAAVLPGIITYYVHEGYKSGSMKNKKSAKFGENEPLDKDLW